MNELKIENGRIFLDEVELLGVGEVNISNKADDNLTELKLKMYVKSNLN